VRPTEPDCKGALRGQPHQRPRACHGDHQRRLSLENRAVSPYHERLLHACLEQCPTVTIASSSGGLGRLLSRDHSRQQGAQVALIGHGMMGAPASISAACLQNVNPGNRGGTTTPISHRPEFKRLESSARVTDWAAQIAQKTRWSPACGKQSMPTCYRVQQCRYREWSRTAREAVSK